MRYLKAQLSPHGIRNGDGEMMAAASEAFQPVHSQCHVTVSFLPLLLSSFFAQSDLTQFFLAQYIHRERGHLQRLQLHALLHSVVCLNHLSRWTQNMDTEVTLARRPGLEKCSSMLEAKALRLHACRIECSIETLRYQRLGCETAGVLSSVCLIHLSTNSLPTRRPFVPLRSGSA